MQNTCTIRAISLTLISLSLVTACGGGSSGPGLAAKDDSKTVGIASPSYHEDIAPLLNNNCVACHRDGGIAPFALDDYAAVISATNMNHHIDTSTKYRTMPPYLADNSGQCNTFKDARWLNDADIATIGNWVDNGMPEGTPPATPLPPPPQLALDPGEVDATAMMQSAYTPVGSPDHPEDDYRCFIIDPGLSKDQFLTAYEVKPGNDAMVHHIILYGLRSDAAETQADTLDNIDAESGYTCFGGSGIQNDTTAHVGFLAGWAPGLNVTRFPTDTGIKLLAGHRLVMQVHYNLANKSGSDSDQTGIDLALSDSVSKEANVFPIADQAMMLQPGLASTSTSISTGPLPSAFKVYGVFPHMHTLGRQIHVDRVSSTGDKTCLIDVPDWSFEWQQFFFYADANGPVTVNNSDSLTLTCTYDTRGRSSVVTWGDGTQDEMCVNFFYTTAP